MTDVHNVYPGDERYPPEILRAFQDLESCSIVEFVPPFRLHPRRPRTAPETAPFSPYSPASSPEEERARSPRDVAAPASPQPGKPFHPFTPNTLPAGFSQALLAHLKSALANPHFTFHQLFSNFSNAALLRSPGRTLARVIQDLYILARALNIPLPTQSPAQSPSHSHSHSPSHSPSEFELSPSPSPSSGNPQSDAPSVHPFHSVHNVHSVHSPSPAQSEIPSPPSSIHNPHSDAPP